MDWNLTNDRPIYLQLEEILLQAIASGQYPAGSRLPAVRELAAEAGVNPNTMQRALTDLEREGLLYSQRTAGRFVTDETERIRGKRRELAMTQIQIFLTSMKEMGFSAEEIVEMMEQAIRKEEEA
ncbi:MAG: GntR family transcriptional regulator [Clostridiales bacterium]|nr:GntR family transcriptional regulator [Clostridiales bacterium]